MIIATILINLQHILTLFLLTWGAWGLSAKPRCILVGINHL